MSLDNDHCQRGVVGLIHYEERQLFNILLLNRCLNTRLIYVSSLPVDPIIIQYYTSLLHPKIPEQDLAERLIFIHLNDGSPRMW
jgi:hypothetical protein